MSLASFLTDLTNRVSIAKIIGQKVAWDPRKPNPSCGEYRGLCPFHQEKAPSFKVDDRKEFYIYFGCHAKGDAIKFLWATGHIGFRLDILPNTEMVAFLPKHGPN
ncbi:MAG: CHC2 zinc finger domain-containing protein [Gemmatimonadota bacterium]|nr:CHC2 zinc finger domain-containing protein [Gemmatimonadota bacterium]